MRINEKLIELHEITERRDGCVWRTKSHGYWWVPFGEHAPAGWQYVSVSTNVAREMLARDENTVRSRKV